LGRLVLLRLVSPARRAALAALVTLLPLLPGMARAASAIYLSWNDCGPSTVSTQDFDFDCGTELGAEELFCAFRMPFATGADVVGVIAVVDLESFTSPLPDYWRLAKGGTDCRAGYLSCVADFTMNGDCADPWLGQAVAEVQAYNEGEPRGGTNQARIKAVAGVVPGLARTLDATSVYYGLKLVFQNTRATGAAQCAGCHDPVCLVLNSIEVKRLTGSPGGDLLFLSTPAPANGNWAKWQGGTGVDCTLVPARSITWGRVKSLYR
jgi:hypothetical protein